MVWIDEWLARLQLNQCWRLYLLAFLGQLGYALIWFLPILKHREILLQKKKKLYYWCGLAHRLPWLSVASFQQGATPIWLSLTRGKKVAHFWKGVARWLYRFQTRALTSIWLSLTLPFWGLRSEVLVCCTFRVSRRFVWGLGSVRRWFPFVVCRMARTALGDLRCRFWVSRTLRADLKVLITSEAPHIILDLRRFVIDHTLLISSFSKLPSSMAAFWLV